MNRTRANELCTILRATADDLEKEATPDDPETPEMPDWETLPVPLGHQRFPNDNRGLRFQSEEGTYRSLSGMSWNPNDSRKTIQIRFVQDACLNAIDAWKREHKRLGILYRAAPTGEDHKEFAAYDAAHAAHTAWVDAYAQFLEAVSDAKE